MAVYRTARSAVDRLRRKTADVGSKQYTDTELLASLDEVLETVWTQTNQGFQDHNLDSFDTETAGIEAPEPDLVTVPDIPGCYEFSPPEFMASVRMIEWKRTGNELNLIPVPTGSLHLGRLVLGNEPISLGWYRASKDRIRIHGLTASPRLRIWYLRRWPPMHFGAHTVGGTTFSATLAATAGRAVLRARVYEGSRVEWNTGNPDAQVLVTGNLTPGVIDFAPALSAPVSIGDQYSLILPCDPEHTNYVLARTALSLIGPREANSPKSQELRAEVADLHASFQADLAERDQARQRRPFSSREFR